MTTLKGLTADRETLTIKAPEGDLHITYKPSRLSVAFLEGYADQVQAAMGEDVNPETAVVNVYAELIGAVVLDWDLEGPIPDEDVFGKEAGSVVAEGEVIPLEQDALRWLGTPTLEYIIEEMRKDAGVKVRTRGGSKRRS